MPGTRMDVIKSILDWFSGDPYHRRTLLLQGLPGTGKSTLSTNIARMMDGIGLLGAFSFFERNLPENSPSRMVRTIAFQLALHDADIGVKVEQIIKNSPDIADLPLATQLFKLLSATAFKDVTWIRGPVLVIIDALDEADDMEEREELLNMLSHGVLELPFFLRLFIISSRKLNIPDQIEHHRVARMELSVDSKEAQTDIYMFIWSRLEATRAEVLDHIPALYDWPRDEDVQSLIGFTSGHFLCAAIACQLIDESKDPQEKLKELIQAGHKSTNANSSSLESLRHLYKNILKSAGNWDDQSFRSDYRDLLGAIICLREPLSCGTLDYL